MATLPPASTTSATVSTAELWTAFLASRSEALRNALTVRYFPLVVKVATQLGAKLSRGVSTDDLIQDGVFGLRDAIEAYDPARSVRFTTFCRLRIRGAILDQLRRLDWLPRRSRYRNRLLLRHTAELEMELGRAPTAGELQQRLGVSDEQYALLIRDRRAIVQHHCDRQGAGRTERGGSFDIESLRDVHAEEAFALLQREDVRRMLVVGMSRVERLILTLYYYENMTMKEIGGTLDMSESRVSQIHSNLLRQLRARAGRRYAEMLGDESTPDPVETAA